MLTIGLTFYFAKQQSHFVEGYRIDSNNQRSEIQRLPIYTWTSNGIHQIEFIVQQSAFSSSIYQISAYECLHSLEVNDHPIDLSTLQPNERCAYKDGFQLELADFLEPGLNTIHLELETHERYLNLQFIQKAGSPRIILFAGILSLLFGITLYMLKGMLKIPQSFIFILIGALAVRLLYLHENAPLNNSHDINGHLNYINQIEENRSIPETVDCWSCYHPPLYYVVAVFWRQTIGEWTGLTPNRSLQVLSLLFDLGFLYAASQIFRIILPSKRVQMAALTMLAFWPGAIIWSIRIGNESLLTPLLTFAFWRLLRWLDSDKKADLILTALLIAVALNVKSSALIALPVFASIYCLKRGLFAPFKFNLIFREWLPVLGIFIVGFAFAAIRPANAYASRKQESLLVGNSSGLNEVLAAPVDVEHLMGFDLDAWIQQPFINPWFGNERFYFSNYYLKTALFGEHEWDDLNIRIQSGYIQTSLLLLWILATLLGMASLKQLCKEHRAYLISGCFWLLLAAWIYRIHLPFTPCADIRFTAPFLVFWTPLICLGLFPNTSAKFSISRNRLGYILLFLWVSSSTAFFASAHFPLFPNIHVAAQQTAP